MSSFEKFDILNFKREDIKTLHYTWIAFFITFYVWFNMAPLATTMLKEIGWLTKEHIKIMAICNVALTIPGRIIVGGLVDKYGPRVIFSILMVTMSIPALFFAFGNTFVQLLVSRLFLSVIGAGFVIGIRMTGQWFPPKWIGRAEGFYAGWGNFGSAAAAMTLPWMALHFFSEYESGWRYALALNAGVCFFYGILYYFLVSDVPKAGISKSFHFIRAKKTNPMLVSSYGDLIQYILWSFPLYGALGVLTWRIGDIVISSGTSRHPFIPSFYIYSIYALLVILYVIHVYRVLHLNLKVLKKGVPEHEKYHWGSIAALNTTYFANFGAELAVVSMLPMFFEKVFCLNATNAGLIAASFAFVNLFARPLGGYLSDKGGNRKKIMLRYMLGIAFGFLCMAIISKNDTLAEYGLIPLFNGTWWLVVAIIITVICSVFVQGAEGATFAFVPLIKKSIQGQVAGMTGAYGNVGAVCYLVIYSLVNDKTFFYIISSGAAFSFIFCWVMLKEPKDAFADE